MVNGFCLSLIISGIMVISAFNSVHSVLWLIAAFTSGIVLFIYMEVDFLAFIYLIVYVGAIAILFLFVIMMLNFTDLKGFMDMTNYLLAAFLIGIAIILEVLFYFSWGIPNLTGGMAYFR